MPSAFSWPVLVPSALRAPAPVNFGVRPLNDSNSMHTIEDPIAASFLDAAEQWLCDGYWLSIRYVAGVERDGAKIWDAAIYLNPLPPDQDNSFKIETEDVLVGQYQHTSKKRTSLMKILKEATKGSLSIPGKKLLLPSSDRIDYYSELHHRDRWATELHLNVRGGRPAPPSSIRLAAIDNALRSASPPFDGLPDALSWLGLSENQGLTNQPSITIKSNPPVDLIMNQSTLQNDLAEIHIHAHPKLDVNRISLALRAAPGEGISSRFQATHLIEWQGVQGGVRRGIARASAKNADNLLAMLMLEKQMIRRHWFIDSSKARNNRLVAAQHFDAELKMTRNAVFESNDSARFENGVAALLFLLGFTPAVQLETAAPDIIVTTPSGRMIIVECTTRIADFPNKLGKLVDRRGSLSKNLVAASHSLEVSAVLVCRLPRDQIAAQVEVLRQNKVLLVANEDLTSAFHRLRLPKDPDVLLDEALARLAPSNNLLAGA
jgi:hypothetical protein